MFLEVIKSIILGIVQGITEWLPISSTGHMILFNQFLNFSAGDKNFRDLFLVVIQFGSILAVVTIYFHRLNPFSPKKTAIEKRNTWTMWLKVAIACIPAGIVGLLLDDWIDKYLYRATVVGITLIVYGIGFIVVESIHKKAKIKTIEEMRYPTAFLIGAFQMLALIPGTSRSGATILGAVILGSDRLVATEFSFFLAVPVMLLASLYKILKYFMKYSMFTGSQTALLLIGMAVAYIVSVFAIKFLVDFIKKHDFKPFGWYRIALGVAVLAYFLISGAQVIK